jgi:WXXGXW repeat (2 copies)
MRTLSYVRCCMFAFVMMLVLGASASSVAQVSIGVTVGFAPPDLPVYEQPMCPGEDYIWTPGYWAYDPDFGDYYWIPGTWVLAPEPGFFWTPAYWAWGGSGFVFYEGYWGPVVGFYGGVNYGYGYFGRGYEGGRWQGRHFYYNQTVNNVNVTIVRNVYKTTINERNVTRVSYNGGSGGINARPTSDEERATRERHIPPVPDQRQHMQAARSDPELRASANRGKPKVAATPKPGALKEHGVVEAREGGAVHGGPKNAGGGGERNAPRPNAVHPKDLPPEERPARANSGNAKADQKYQKDQDKLYSKQEKDRQKLEQRQEKEDQRLAKQNADEGRRKQTEQRHQQQTQQMEQKHSQQRQQMESKQPPPKP